MNQDQPEIERASEADQDGVIELLKICGLYIPEGTEYMLGIGRTLVARIGKKIVGTRSFRSTSGPYWHVYGLCVHPDYRRRGIAERLHREAERMMFKEGARGYVGEAASEEVAQYYVRTFGVRICRLSFRAWRTGKVPYRKDFLQKGRVDRGLIAIRRLIIFLMGMRYFGTAFEFAARKIERL